MRLYVLLAAMPLSMGIAVRAPDKDPDPSLTLVPKGDRKASFPPLSEPKYIQTRSLRAEEDAIFNFYDGINWQGNNTWSGAKSHMEDCVQVTMPHVESFLMVDSSDQRVFLCTAYDTCECKGNSQIIFGSVKDFTLPMFEDWAHNLKSYNCTWVDTVEESSTVTPRTKKEAQQSTTLSSLPGEDAIFNFFSEPWWNGTQTFSGNQSCVEECIKVPMFHIESFNLIAASDFRKHDCVVYNTDDCHEGRTMNVTGSIFDFEGMGMLNWTDQMKSYNCRWLEPKYDPEHPPPPPGPPTPYPENPDNHLLKLYQDSDFTGNFTFFSHPDEQMRHCESAPPGISSYEFLPIIENEAFVCQFFEKRGCWEDPMNKQYLDGESNNVYPYWNDSIGSIQCMWYGKQMERREFVEEPRRPENAQLKLYSDTSYAGNFSYFYYDKNEINLGGCKSVPPGISSYEFLTNRWDNDFTCFFFKDENCWADEPAEGDYFYDSRSSPTMASPEFNDNVKAVSCKAIQRPVEQVLIWFNFEPNFNGSAIGGGSSWDIGRCWRTGSQVKPYASIKLQHQLDGSRFACNLYDLDAGDDDNGFSMNCDDPAHKIFTVYQDIPDLSKLDIRLEDTVKGYKCFWIDL